MLAGAALLQLCACDAAAQAGGLFINAVFLDINPADMPKFMEAIKENGAASVKEPGCRTFNIHVSAKDPNQVLLYEVYDNAAALDSHGRVELEGALVSGSSRGAICFQRARAALKAISSGSVGPVRAQERARLPHRDRDPVLRLLPREQAHFRLRREHHGFHRDGVRMRRRVVGHDQHRRLA